MASLLARGWPPEDLSGWLARIDAVNTQFVAKLAADRLGPQGRRIVVVGDADRLEEPLRGLGLTMEVVRGQSRN
jgi:predicted Zn-dependent peptidase